MSAGATRCNCSICTMVAQTGNMVKPDAFRLLTDEAKASIYEWGGKITQRFFCKTCGVHAFGRGHLAEVGGDFVSVNFNCLDDVDTSELTIGYWDGRHDNWHAGMRSTPWPIFAPLAVDRASRGVARRANAVGVGARGEIGAGEGTADGRNLVLDLRAP